MTLTALPVTGSTRIVAVGDPSSLARGRPAEFRHRGLSIAMRPTAIAALLELGREPGSVVLVPTDLPDMPLAEFVDVLRSVAHVPVIAGLTADCAPQTISELFDHGIASTVELPATPGRLAEAVAASRLPDYTNQSVIRVGNIALDDIQHRVAWFGREVTLAPRNFDVLRYMLLAYPRVVSLRELGQLLGGAPTEQEGRARVAIGRMRVAFADADPDRPTPIETLHRVGYRLRP